MNRTSVIDTGNRTTCVQPYCLLKGAGMNAHHLAKLVVRILAGEPLESMVPKPKRISLRLQCVPCALRIMQGRKAYLTEYEWKRLDDLGHWHHRRQRRGERLDI